MVIKINYTSSDIYVSTSVSPVYVVVSNGGSNGSAVWGQITGTLSNQTDLQNALNAKFDDPTGTTAQYLRGDGSLATFPTITNGTVTSVDMSVPTGLTISGNPITSSGTLAVGLASGYSIPSTASQATWNTAYNDSIVSAGVTGTTTKTLTLNQQDGGTVTASWSDIDTGLTSVGLSMPVAFSVANTPLTSNGTLEVSAAGTSAQYIRGDGQLANFPTNGGGGSSVNYYLNGSVSQGTFGGDTYYEMSKTPVLGAGTDFTRTNAQGNGYIASFITDAGDPSLLSIPGGNWNLEFYFNASSSGSTPQFYGEIYKVDASNNFTLIASASANPETISSGTIVDQYFTSIPVPQTSLLSTDRLAVRIYVIPSGRTITLHTENSNLCEVLTTFSTGLNALNGLTAQVQYFAVGTSGTDFAINSLSDTHTFNLPTASATNRGALSAANWTTFNAKQDALNGTGFVKISGTTISYDNSTYALDSAVVHNTGTETIAGTKTLSSAPKLSAGLLIADGSLSTLSGHLGIGGLTDGIVIKPSNAGTNNILFQTGGFGYTYTFPGDSGTVALTSDIPSLSGYVTGTGTTNYLPKWTSGSAIGNSLVYDDGTNVGIGTIPTVKLDVAASGIGIVRIKGGNLTNEGAAYYVGGSTVTLGAIGDRSAILGGTPEQAFSIYTGSVPLLFDVAGSERSRITSGGNLLVGTTADNGSKLQVSGAATFGGRTIVAASYIADLGGVGNNCGILFGPGAVFSTDGTGTLTTKNLGSSANPWGSLWAGAATFSSSVTATSFIKSGGTSSQYLMADGSVTTGGGGGSVDELQVSLICQVFG
jgi:hypothetical protein